MALPIVLAPWGGIVSWTEVTYLNVKKIGEGGAGQVHLVMASMGPTKGLLFAAKIFREVEDKGWRDDFMKEVHFLRKCDHPSIVRVYDEGLWQDRFPFVILEYFPRRLHDLLKEGTLATAEKLQIALQLLSALAYLARLEPPAIHRDIKPQNIFLKDRSAVLGDFGLIKQLTSESAGGGPVEPSKGDGMAQRYRTPDLVDYVTRGRLPTTKSDVFQLGLVLAELFTGENPERHGGLRKPVELNPLPNVPDERMWPAIQGALADMLILDSAARPSAGEMIGRWQELYQECLRRTAGFPRSE